MVCFSLPVPHLVLSSRQMLNGEISLNALTPFGQMEISFSATSPEKEPHRPLDIHVESDRISWLLDESLPASFRNALVDFVGQVVIFHSRRPVNSPCELNVEFRYAAGDITLSGFLPPYASAIAGG